MKYKVDFTTQRGIDQNMRPFIEISDSITNKVVRRYMDYVEASVIENIEQHALIVLAQTVYEECQKRGLNLSFHN